MDIARWYTDISQNETDIIKSARKKILINKEEQWVKTRNDTGFDVAMGSLDSALLSDLIGLLILYNLTKKLDTKDVAIYRDDGLMVVSSVSRHKCDRIRKCISRTLKDMGLLVEIKSNVKIVNFLDVTFNLMMGCFEPFLKPNTTPIYVNPKSNHPPSIIRKIPHSIECRISKNPSNEQSF